jgi:hypothetical protein
VEAELTDDSTPVTDPSSDVDDGTDQTVETPEN